MTRGEQIRTVLAATIILLGLVILVAMFGVWLERQSMRTRHLAEVEAISKMLAPPVRIMQEEPR